MYLIILSGEFKDMLNFEIKQWQNLYTDGLLETSKLKSLTKYVIENYNTLAMPISTLDDAKKVILLLEKLEFNLSDLDYDIENTVGLYSLLNKFKVAVAPDEEKQVNALMDNHNKLKAKVTLVLK